MKQVLPGRWRRTADVLRFWLVDLWGRDWDPHRRSLLAKHYWAYFRNPPIPHEYLPATSNTAASEDQRTFSAAFRHRIEQVQAGASRSHGVFLTYRPIGKNLRLLGTAIRENAERGRRVCIEPDGPPTERRALAARGFDWSPWVWTRTGAVSNGVPDAALAWNELFRNPPAAASLDGHLKGVRPLPKLDQGTGPFSRAHLATVLKVAAATRYVATPSVEVMAQIEAVKTAAGWPSDGRPVLGIHVRRGDAASAKAASELSTRKSFPLTTYLETADEMCRRYGIRDIFLATESREEIERATRLRPQYRFLWLDYDRSIFPDIATSSQFIEDLALEHPERAKTLAITAIMDLYFFCECHAFIGAFNSEFSVLAWLLATGARGHVVPYVSLSRAAPGRSLNPFAALLNLRNNCPLELYHW